MTRNPRIRRAVLRALEAKWQATDRRTGIQRARAIPNWLAPAIEWEWREELAAAEQARDLAPHRHEPTRPMPPIPTFADGNA